MKNITKFIFLIILSLGLIFSADEAWAMESSITVSGGNITLTNFTAAAGQDLNPVISTTCALTWSNTGMVTEKITVATSLSSPTYALKVVATGVTNGTAAAEVTLSTTATDFVTGIAKKSGGGCNLTYTAVATAAQGTGTDYHTITYTIIDG